MKKVLPSSLMPSLLRRITLLKVECNKACLRSLWKSGLRMWACLTQMACVGWPLQASRMTRAMVSLWR